MVPMAFGGTMILCMMSVFSTTVPNTSPPVTLSPTLKLAGVNGHGFLRSSASVLMPFGMKMLLEISAMLCESDAGG